MCGIVGIYAHKNKTNKCYHLEEFLSKLIHRGPDDQGTWQDENIILGHTRLSILDLSSLGHQPMAYQNERYWITYNGEIYNYQELRETLKKEGFEFKSQTDTEVLLAAYAHWGKDCLGQLRGMFAFAIWDRQTKTLFLVRDRTGEKPLYYYGDRQQITFASELKALVALLPETPALEPAAIDQYLHYQYIPEPLTPLKGVHKLPAAHYLEIQCQGETEWVINPQPYWQLEKIKPREGDPVPLIKAELDNTIRLMLRSDVPVGLALSGGIDSGAIAALAAPQYRDTLKCFSVGYPGRPAYDERQQAEDLAKQLGLPFFDVELLTQDLVNFFPDLVAAMDDPIADIAAYGHYAVMKLAREQGVKVMLGGLGGDELFWGYPWTVKAVNLTQTKSQCLKQSSPYQSLLQSIEQITRSRFYRKLIYTNKIPNLIQTLISKIGDLGYLDLAHPSVAVYQNLVPNFSIALKQLPSLYTSSFIEKIPPDNAVTPYDIQWKNIEFIPIQICQILFDTWLVSNCLSLGDRLSMASSVEVRLPFLDHKLIELVIGLRQTYPDHQLGSKYWLKQALKEIIPDEVLNRPKQGFQPPVGEWIEQIITRYMDCLLAGYLVDLDVFNPDYLVKLYNEFKRAKRQSLGFILYKCLLLEIWYRKVVKQESFP